MNHFTDLRCELVCFVFTTMTLRVCELGDNERNTKKMYTAYMKFHQLMLGGAGKCELLKKP